MDPLHDPYLGTALSPIVLDDIEEQDPYPGTALSPIILDDIEEQDAAVPTSANIQTSETRMKEEISGNGHTLGEETVISSSKARSTTKKRTSVSTGNKVRALEKDTVAFLSSSNNTMKEGTVNAAIASTGPAMSSIRLCLRPEYSILIPAVNGEIFDFSIVHILQSI